MEEGIQKASVLKRVAASLLDLIAISIIATLLSWGLSVLTGYDSWNEKLEGAYEKYENQYSITFRITAEDYESYSEEVRGRWDDAYDALISDSDAMKAYSMVTSLMVMTVSLSIFFSFIIWEFIVPLFLKDGRTLGKLFLGLAVMRSNGVRINSVSLFARAVLGKYAIETMVPVIIIMMIFMNSIGIVGPMVILAIIVLELFLISFTRNNQLLHCLVSDTVVVDYGSQMIYESEEALLEAKKERARERAETATY